MTFAAMTAPTCYVNRCTQPGTATGSFRGMCPPDAQRARRIVADARTT